LSLFGVSMPKGEKSIESLGITLSDTILALFYLVLTWLVSIRFPFAFYLSNNLNLKFVCGQVCILNYVVGYLYISLHILLAYPCYYLVDAMHCS
jgi:hypothetical protein